MFFTVPSEANYLSTNTPFGVKSIRALFFESKNDSLFGYKRNLDRISIIIDGKQICRDLIILPFMTTQPYGNRKHRWEDVALKVNMNVDISEIQISGIQNNDFNIVFVCSDKEIDESEGFDFVETKLLRLKGQLTGEEARKALNDAFKMLDASCAEGETPADELTINGITYYRKRYTFNGQETTTIEYTEVKKYISNNSNGELTFDKEFQFIFDHEPIEMFAYPIMTANGIDRIINADMRVAFTISGSDNEVFPPYTDLSLFSANEKIPFRKALHKFETPLRRNISFCVTRNDQETTTAKEIEVSNYDIYVLFIYKKVS
ncbi:MAG: hypothetical protein MJ197_03575 [Bacteroidales bacterium]|nr:hypothetical protein [Bacteroidales bacterium]